MQVRVLSRAPILQRVGEPGRPCLPWKQEIGGSNPPALTNLRSSSVGRAADSDSAGRGFKAFLRSQIRPGARVVIGRFATPFRPVRFRSWHPTLQWLEGIGVDLLNRMTPVRIRPGAPTHRRNSTAGELGEWSNQRRAKAPRPQGSSGFESRALRHPALQHPAAPHRVPSAEGHQRPGMSR